MGAGRRQRERAGVEKYQLEPEKGKSSSHPPSPISGVLCWGAGMGGILGMAGARPSGLLMQACCLRAVRLEVLTASLSRIARSRCLQGWAGQQPLRKSVLMVKTLTGHEPVAGFMRITMILILKGVGFGRHIALTIPQRPLKERETEGSHPTPHLLLGEGGAEREHESDSAWEPSSSPHPGAGARLGTDNTQYGYGFPTSHVQAMRASCHMWTGPTEHLLFAWLVCSSRSFSFSGEQRFPGSTEVSRVKRSEQA